jgi:hypothetical protein
LKNSEQFTGAKGEPPATTKSGKPIEFVVKKFRLENGKVLLGVGVAGMSLPMTDIELTDLGTKESGITPDQLVFAVMKNVTGSIVSATTKAVGDIGKTTDAAAAEARRKLSRGSRGCSAGRSDERQCGRELAEVVGWFEWSACWHAVGRPTAVAVCWTAEWRASVNERVARKSIAPLGL